MVIHERRKDKRILTQLCLLLVVAAIGLFGWTGNYWISGLDSKFEMLFKKYDEVNKKTDCLAHNIDKCCAQAVECV